MMDDMEKQTAIDENPSMDEIAEDAMYGSMIETGYTESDDEYEDFDNLEDSTLGSALHIDDVGDEEPFVSASMEKPDKDDSETSSASAIQTDIKEEKAKEDENIESNNFVSSNKTVAFSFYDLSDKTNYDIGRTIAKFKEVERDMRKNSNMFRTNLDALKEDFTVLEKLNLEIDSSLEKTEQFYTGHFFKVVEDACWNFLEDYLKRSRVQYYDMFKIGEKHYRFFSDAAIRFQKKIQYGTYNRFIWMVRALYITLFCLFIEMGFIIYYGFWIKK